MVKNKCRKKMNFVYVRFLLYIGTSEPNEQYANSSLEHNNWKLEKRVAYTTSDLRSFASSKMIKKENF